MSIRAVFYFAMLFAILFGIVGTIRTSHGPDMTVMGPISVAFSLIAYVCLATSRELKKHDERIKRLEAAQAILGAHPSNGSEIK